MIENKEVWPLNFVHPDMKHSDWNIARVEVGLWGNYKEERLMHPDNSWHVFWRMLAMLAEMQMRFDEKGVTDEWKRVEVAKDLYRVTMVVEEPMDIWNNRLPYEEIKTQSTNLERFMYAIPVGDLFTDKSRWVVRFHTIWLGFLDEAKAVVYQPAEQNYGVST